ncbi:hypothetical protein GCM10010502_51830 [Kitasatospora aureofaciens]|uniref:Uncharacterized protein n=1 Tax=Kitasatospora aureofaciens TaxID=1894 RepID=A0A8H9LU10_KITAU|nr:hypothetical protein GCM10010502_51830 [Kitasatospora aureofaciens]
MRRNGHSLAPVDGDEGALLRRERVVVHRALKHHVRGARDRGRVALYTGAGDGWTQVRGATDRVFTSRTTLYATDLTTGDIEQYDRGRGTWTRIGGPGATFAATDDHLYGVSPDHSGVFEYTGANGAWTEIGGPVAP